MSNMPFFTFSDEYEFGLVTADKIIRDEKFEGRPACDPHDYGILAQTIGLAGRGLYVELGVLYGASAILAAMTKAKFGIAGPVVGVDIFQDYYGNGRDPKTPEVPIIPETVKRNAARYGVAQHLMIIPGRSYPIPAEVSEIDYPTAVVFIDGDHKGNGPISDFYGAMSLDPKYIIFHDYSPEYPDVVRACQTVAATYPYTVVHVSGTMFVLEKESIDG